MIEIWWLEKENLLKIICPDNSGYMYVADDFWLDFNYSVMNPNIGWAKIGEL